MVRALHNVGPDSSHLEFFGLTRPPFVRLVETSEFFHTEQYSLLMAHLASATEQPDCLVVICGATGSGKTTLLNRYIASLGNDVSYATIDESCNGEKQFYCALLRQLGFNDITGSARELRRIAKEFLVHRAMAGDPVLIMIDNAHLTSPAVLEQLRWISAIKVKDRRVLSVVLAGNSDLTRVMESPAMSQTRFNSHVRFNIRAYTEVEVGDYISHRLKSAGGSADVSFSSDVVPLFYRYTGGIPSLINMLCNAVLTEASAQKTHDITVELVNAVADNRRLLPHVVPLQAKGRRKTDPDFKLVQPETQADERITAREFSNKEPLEIPTLTSAVLDVDVKNLLPQITQLSVELGELRANRRRVLKDIGKRDLEVSKLREKLEVQSVKTEELASALGDKTDEVKQLNKALTDGELALQKNEEASIKLATDLKKAKLAKVAAQTDSANAQAKADVLSQLTSELQATVSGLTVDLKLADQRAGEMESLEKSTAALKDEIAKKSGELLTVQGELDARDKSLGELEKLFQHSQSESETLRLSADALHELEESVSEKEQQITVLKAELASRNEEIMALETSSGERAYRDPDSTATMAAFEVAKCGEIQQVMELAEGESRIMIGRAKDNDLCLSSEFVSRHHALISCTEGVVHIEDLNSFNGTAVNSRKITRCELLANDVVEIGDFQVTTLSRIE